MQRADHPDRVYLELSRKILDYGNERSDRTGVGTYSLFGPQLTFRNVDFVFPLLTTKKIHFKSIVHELLWFLSGDTNVKYLQDNGVTIWDSWINENGDLGPVYGHQWRRSGYYEYWDEHDSGEAVYSYLGVDRSAEVEQQLKQNPFSRRHIVSSWNPVDIPSMALPPCHCLFQFYVEGHEEVNKLHLKMYQRSADYFLGVPFNIASYALLLKMFASVCKYQVGDLIISFGDVHIYKNHVEQIKLQEARFEERYEYTVTPPTVLVNSTVNSVLDFKYDDITLRNYNPYPAIKAPIAV